MDCLFDFALFFWEIFVGTYPCNLVRRYVCPVNWNWQVHFPGSNPDCQIVEEYCYRHHWWMPRHLPTISPKPSAPSDRDESTDPVALYYSSLDSRLSCSPFCDPASRDYDDSKLPLLQPRFRSQGLSCNPRLYRPGYPTSLVRLEKIIRSLKLQFYLTFIIEI